MESPGFTPLVTLFAASFAIAFSGALMPGPLLTATITESTRRGPSAGPLIIAGHAVLESCLLVALMLGLSPILAKDGVFVGISFLGGAVLAWMAAGMFRSLSSLSLPRGSQKGRGNRLVWTGVAMSLSNPYWTVWWATIGLGAIVQARRFGVPGVAAFFSGHILADLGWYSLVSFAVGKGKRFFSDRIYRRLVAVLAVLMLAFAAAFIFAGAGRLSAIVRG
jgi:threonine/homoserine/homoserine lactone efflux protein